MAYEDWMPEFQDTWQNLPIDWGEVSDTQMEEAEYYYEIGFMSYHGEESRATIEFAREAFFDTLGISREDFDWSGWREAMGYE